MNDLNIYWMLCYDIAFLGLTSEATFVWTRGRNRLYVMFFKTVSLWCTHHDCLLVGLVCIVDKYPDEDCFPLNAPDLAILSAGCL